MSVLLETSLGDLVVDLDVQGSPLLVRNFLRLVQARYYTQTLLYSVVPGRCVYGGDPWGNGTGGACADALLSLSSNQQDDKDDDALLRHEARFLASQGRRLTPDQCREKGRVVAVELQGIANTVGSQFLITIGEGPDQALDGYTPNSADTTTNEHVSRSTGWLSLGTVVEDENSVLDQLNRTFIDQAGRPYADIRVNRALIVHNPFPDEALLWPRDFLEKRGIQIAQDDNHDKNIRVVHSPSPERPAPECIEARIPIEQVLEELQDADGEVDPEVMRQRLRAQAQADRRQQDSSRARVLEMLGDLPDAQISAPKNVLFVAKLNPITTDEDLQLIFSRFDPNVKVDIIRDQDSGQSLQYAFCAFTEEKQAVEAYFKMNQALVDDRRILVDFSQSVSHVWDKYRQQYRNMPLSNSLDLTNNARGDRGGGKRNSKDNRSSFPGRRNDYSRDRGKGHDRSLHQHQPDERSHKGRSSHYGDQRERSREKKNDRDETHQGLDRNDSRMRYDDTGDESHSRGSGRGNRFGGKHEEQPRHDRKRNDTYGSDDDHYRHRRRYDSDEEEEKRRRKNRRYDSDDSDRERKRRRKEKHSHRKRHDSDDSDDSKRRKKRHKKSHRHRSDRDDGSRQRDDDRYGERHRKDHGDRRDKEGRLGRRDDRRHDDCSSSRKSKHERKHRDRNDDQRYRKRVEDSRRSKEANVEDDHSEGRSRHREERSEQAHSRQEQGLHRHRERGRDGRSSYNKEREARHQQREERGHAERR